MTLQSFLNPPISNIETISTNLYDSWTSPAVAYVFIFTNVLALVPSVLIVFSVFWYKQMRTVDNLIISQIGIIDCIYAIWSIIWFSAKLITKNAILNNTTCQLEAAISAICKITWLYSALVCAFWRYHTIVNGATMSKTSIILLQLSQWVLPFSAGALIGSTSRFDLMPSGGYCYLAYHPNDPLLKGYFFLTIFVIIIPTILALFFYYSITRQFYIIVTRVTENSNSSSSTLLGFSKNDNRVSGDTTDDKYLCYPPSPTSPTIPITEKEKLARSPSLTKYRAVAFRSTMYCTIFVLSFLPYGLAMIWELITDSPRSPLIDFITVSAVMFHKVLSPIVTLFINASILAQVKKLIRL